MVGMADVLCQQPCRLFCRRNHAITTKSRYLINYALMPPKFPLFSWSDPRIYTIINKTLDKITCYVIVRSVLLFKGERVVEKAKLLIEELSELTGAEIEFSQDGICELAVEDRLLMLRYRPQDNDWLYFGVVMEREEELSRDDLKKALCLNLFGAETLGLHLGLFGNSLILSGTAAMETLTAEALAEKLLFLSRHIATLSQKFQSAESGPVSAEPAEMPFNANFISV